MKLYLADRAPNPDRVKFFLKEKGALDRVERFELSIPGMEHRSPEYRARSPLSQVPALEFDDGFTLTESRAICTYLEGEFPEPNLMGRDARERAEIEMWDRRIELLYFFPLASWFRNTHPAMAELEKPQSAEWAEISRDRATRMVAFIDRRLAASPFVAGDRFTIADITLFVSLGLGRVMKFKPWETHPNLAAWRDRMAARPGLAG